MHTDVGGHARAFVIDGRSDGAVRGDRATHLDRNTSPEVEPVHLHHLLSVATAHEFHLPYLELTETRHRYGRGGDVRRQRSTDPAQVESAIILHAIDQRRGESVVAKRQ